MQYLNDTTLIFIFLSLLAFGFYIICEIIGELYERWRPMKEDEYQ